MQTFIDSLGNWVTLTLGAITGATISAIVATNINKTNRKNSILKSDLEDLKRIAYLIASILYLDSEKMDSEKYYDAQNVLNYRATAEFQKLLQRLNEELGVNKYYRDDDFKHYTRLDVPEKIEMLKEDVNVKIKQVESKLNK